ncbi:MAG: formate dehydrogenase accessory sulfurtransferase FdhD [Syntrophomonadaceae bacterium]|nr:formate dehydrogenase accessory sulfurtransferase FdhD [Syntrophomonadaceae bacterium]
MRIMVDNIDNTTVDFRTVRRSVQRWTREGKKEELSDCLVREFSVTIYLNEQEIVTLLCTPEYLEDLAVGFLVFEGMLRSKEELESVIADYDQGQIWVRSRASDYIAEKTVKKRYLAAGGGKGTSFYSLIDVQNCNPINAMLRIAPEQVLAGMKELQARSELFQTTGGVHSALLASKEEVILYREDIGRHNAVDKILGHCFRQGLAPGELILFTSGRLSFEMLLKVAKFGIPILVSRSAPTNLAVELAERLGVTLVGFTRGSGFNVYCHSERIAIAK